MSKQRLVGYKIKKSLKSGDIVGDIQSCYEEVYEPLEPLEELADYAYNLAHIRNDPELGAKIEELVDQIRGQS